MSARVAAVHRPGGGVDTAVVTGDELAVLRRSGHLAGVRRVRGRR